VTTRILLVEDEADVRETLVAALDIVGIHVTSAVDADGALEVLDAESEEEPFDLVVSDVQLPGMDGIDLAGEIHARQPALPILLLTAYDAGPILERSLAAGVYSIVSKPTSPETLARTIERARRRPCVLVVDDQESCASTMAACLEQAGMHAITTTSGPGALALLDETEIDVCVVDLVMPGMDGVETWRHARSLHPDLAVVGITGHDVSTLVSGLREMGAVECLRKPVLPITLVRTIAKARRALDS